jgi:hypothetical protein
MDCAERRKLEITWDVRVFYLSSAVAVFFHDARMSKQKQHCSEERDKDTCMQDM